MTDHLERLRAAFRINLEQQKKRAKELLKAAKSGDLVARQRFEPLLRNRDSELRLADAQFVISRELGLSSWAELKAHVASMDGALRSMRQTPPLDRDMNTLHLRCGSDIKLTLSEAGFAGDFLEHSYPYAHGPVPATPDAFDIQARFLAEFADVTFDGALHRRHEEERALRESARSYERIVLWMEHDCFDQLVLIRCLAHYATLATRPVLELINVDRFPGSIRFLGLGQLPAEALAILWKRRQPVTDEQLTLANAAWPALSMTDPRPLAAIMRTNTPSLPTLAPALHRLLQELPSAEQGIGFTERLILERLIRGSVTLIQLFATLTYETDPLPFATDLMLLRLVKRMEEVTEPVITVSAASRVWDSTVSITQTGRQVLEGALDFLSLRPTPRWIGGVEISQGNGWRWDESSRDAVFCLLPNPRKPTSM